MAAFTARVLLYDANPGRPLDANVKLLARGYHCMTAENADELLNLAQSEHPDVVIINTNPGDGEETITLALKNVWRDSAAPVILIGDHADVERRARALNEGIADYLPHDYRDVELFARLRTLVRLNTMQEELDRRIVTAEQYGIKDTVAASPDVEIDDEKLVVIGDNEASNAELAGMIGEDRVALTTTVDHEVMSALTTTNHDALVISYDSSGRDFMLLCQDVRNNSRLFNLPILVVADADSFEDPDQPYEAGVSDVIHRPVDGEELRNRIDSLVTQQRYRYAMRKVFADTMRPMTTDGLTGLFCHGYFHENLAHQVADALKWHKNLTIALFDVKNIAQFNVDYGYVAGDLLIRQIATMITGLLRGEDLSARYGGDEFIVALPETPPEVAEVALRRIASVIGATEFAVADMTEAVPVYLQVGVASVQEGDTAEVLIERAKADLK